MQLFRSIISTPIGDMLALSSDEGLCALEFTTVEGPNRGQERLTRLNARLGRWFPPHEIVDRESPTIARTRGWLAAYFDGTAAEIGDLPLDMRGAPFEKRVWTALTAIPPGQTTSYGAIARALDSAGRVARGGRRQRREPGGDHRAVPPRHRRDRIADRLRRRPRAQDVAHRPRAPLAPRAATGVVLTTTTTQKPQKSQKSSLVCVFRAFAVECRDRSSCPSCLRVFVVCIHSYRSARIGSTLVARRAGT